MKTLLEVKDLQVSFDTHAGEVQAVRGVTFDLKKGETLAIVGESGSGKSVTSKALMGLIPNPPGRIKNGEIVFEGRDLTKLTEKEMQQVRGKDIAMIFQDPMTSLNPTMTINYAEMDRIRYVYDYAHNLDLEVELLIIVILYMDELDSHITHHLLLIQRFDHGTLHRCGH